MFLMERDRLNKKFSPMKDQQHLLILIQLQLSKAAFIEYCKTFSYFKKGDRNKNIPKINNDNRHEVAFKVSDGCQPLSCFISFYCF